MLKLARAAAALVVVVCACELHAAVHPESGLFFIQTWSPKTYGASPQNWAVAQDRRGVMYFGNTDGLLEYDGVSWRRIKIPNGTAVRSLAVDGNGTVFVGAQRDFGYLQADKHDDLQFVSLLNSVPEEHRKFTDVWTIIATGEGVYFRTRDRVFRWNFGTMKVWGPPAGNRFGQLMVSSNVPYALVPEAGLFRLENDAWKLMPGGEKFAKDDIRGVYPAGANLMVIARRGMFIGSGSGFDQLPSSSKLLEEAQLYATAMLNTGEFALATQRGGLLIVNQRGEVQRVISTAEGLPSEKINALLADRQNGVWMALESGVARVDLSLTQFDKRLGLNGSVYAVARDRDWLYVGTAVGAFRLKSGSKQAGFEGVKGLEDFILCMLPTPTGMLIGSQRGIHRMVKGQAKAVLKADAIADLEISPRDPNVLYAAGLTKVFLLTQGKDGWTLSKEVASGKAEARTVVEDSDGRVWETTRLDIARIDFRTDPPTVERFAAKNGVPDGWKNAYSINGRVFFATDKGLLHFDPADSMFKPDSSLGAQFADGSHGVSIIRESPNGDIWITGHGYQGILQRKPGGGYDWSPMPLLRSGIGELYALWLDPDGIAWGAGEDGWLARYDLPAASRNATEFSVLLRRVQDMGTQASLFAGAGSESASAPRIAYRDASLRFEFAAPLYEAEGSTEYQVKLDGADSAWTPWSTETRKDYTNLFEGSYTFHVRARNPRGQIAEASTYYFSVVPPWYRTWWAYSLYVLVGAAAIWLFLKWRLAQLSARNVQLEQIVEERTVEIRRQRDQIQIEEEKTKALLLNILPAAVAEELRTTGSVAPMVFNEVTVCFTDFVGFTLSSEHLPADVLVSTLHEYFTAFDEIVTRYGMEKLKTIGDSYMFVSGLPLQRRSHALDATMAAMEMMELCRRMEQRSAAVAWKLRIGLHTGPVVAGVVGVRKFAFDVWGNTVNLASRMESSGEPDRVNVSGRTYEEIREFIDCESRGLVTTKDGRALEMHFVRELRANVADRDAFAKRYRTAFSEEPHEYAIRSVIPV